MSHVVPFGYKVLHGFILPNRYEELREISAGAQDFVAQAFDKSNKTHVTIRRITLPDYRADMAGGAERYLFGAAYKQLMFMLRINVESIPKLLNCFTPFPDADSMREFYIVTEYMEGNLDSLDRKCLNHDAVAFIVHEVLRVLKFLQSLNIAHRNISPSNILFNNNKIKVCGFESSNQYAETGRQGLFTAYLNKREYRAPEMFSSIPNQRESAYGAEVDMWSLGVIFADLLVGHKIFQADDSGEQFREIFGLLGTPDESFLRRFSVEEADILRTLTYNEPTFYETFKQENLATELNGDVEKCNQATNLLKRMLEIDPKNRISIEEALDHPYLEEYNQVPPLFNDKEVDINRIYEFNNALTSTEFRDAIFQALRRFAESFNIYQS